MQRDRWFHRAVALTRLPSIVLVTHLTTPDKPDLSVLMKVTDDDEDRPSRAATKKRRAAESVLRRRLGPFVIPRLGGLHHVTTKQSEIGRLEKAALSGVGRASVDDALRRVGNILEPCTFRSIASRQECARSLPSLEGQSGHNHFRSGIQQPEWFSSQGLNTTQYIRSMGDERRTGEPSN